MNYYPYDEAKAQAVAQQRASLDVPDWARSEARTQAVQPPAPHSLDMLMVKLQQIENTILGVNGTLHHHLDRISGFQPEKCGSDNMCAPAPEGQLALLHGKADWLMELLIITSAQAGRLESV